MITLCILPMPIAILFYVTFCRMLTLTMTTFLGKGVRTIVEPQRTRTKQKVILKKEKCHKISKIKITAHKKLAHSMRLIFQVHVFTDFRFFLLATLVTPLVMILGIFAICHEFICPIVFFAVFFVTGFCNQNSEGNDLKFLFFRFHQSSSFNFRLWQRQLTYGHWNSVTLQRIADVQFK